MPKKLVDQLDPNICKRAEKVPLSEISERGTFFRRPYFLNVHVSFLLNT